MEIHDEPLAERLKKVWTSPVYAFYKATPEIEDVGDQRFHIFECIAPQCKAKGKNGRHIRRNLSTSDATSTSNLRKHAEACWGKEALEGARNASSVSEARKVLMTHTPRDGSITIAFARIQGKGKITFSTRPPTTAEIRADHVRWMAESKRAFNLVNDNGYHRVMKNGRPSHYIPSRQTVARDLLKVFSHSRERISRLLKVCVIQCARLFQFDLQYLQEHQGDLSFCTDAWTSPNHRAYVAITVHLEKDGVPSTTLLDIIEVAESHTGAALAAAFARVLQEFEIEKR